MLGLPDDLVCAVLEPLGDADLAAFALASRRARRLALEMRSRLTIPPAGPAPTAGALAALRRDRVEVCTQDGTSLSLARAAAGTETCGACADLGAPQRRLEAVTIHCLAARLQPASMQFLRRVDLRLFAQRFVAAPIVSDILRGAAQLEEVVLPNYHLTHGDAQALSGLRRLRLLHARGCRCLFPVLLPPSLTDLDVAAATLHDCTLRGIANLPELRSLDASVADVPPETLRAVAALPTLRQLTVECAAAEGLGDALASASFAGRVRTDSCEDAWEPGALARLCETAYSIEATGCGILDDALAPLRCSAVAAPALRELALGFNSLTSAGALCVARNLRALQRLDLSGNKIDDDGATAIARWLEALRELDISHNMVTGRGALPIALMRNLDDLDVSHNPISEEDADRILLETRARRVRMRNLGTRPRFPR